MICGSPFLVLAEQRDEHDFTYFQSQMIRAAGIFVLFFQLSFVLSAQRTDYCFDHLDLRKGAGVNRLNILGFDSIGRAWFITEKGIASYDGFLIRNTGEPKGGENALLDRTISGAFLGEDGKIYVGYFEAGLSIYDPIADKWKHEVPDTLHPNGFPNGMVSRIKVEKDGTVFLLTWGAGFSIKRPGQEWKNYYPVVDDPTSLSSTRLKEVVRDIDGTYLIGSWEGDGYENRLQQLNIETGKFSDFPIGDYLNGISEKEQNYIRSSLRIIHSIHIDRTGNLWVATYSGLIFIDRKNKSAKRITARLYDNQGNLENTRTIEEGPNGKLWVGTQSTGILVVDPRLGTCVNLHHDVNVHQGISDDRIRNIKRDKNGNLWISTGSGLIDVLVPVKQEFEMISNQILKADFNDRSAEIMPLTRVFSDSRGLIYAMSASGISLYNRKESRLDRIINLSEIQYKEKNVHPDLIKHTKVANCMAELPNGDILIGSRSALFRFDPITNSIKKNWGLARFSVDCFAWSPDSTFIWFFGYHSRELMKYHIREDEIEIVDVFDSNRWINYRQFFDLGNGLLLFEAGERDGFYLYSIKEKSFERWSKNEKTHFFPDSTILFLNQDAKRNVWIGTETGLYLFDRKSNKVEPYHELLGITNKPVHVIVSDRSGVMWIGMEGDLMRYDPISGEKFLFTRGFGCEAGLFGSFTPYVDNNGSIYFTTLKGIMIIDPDNIYPDGTIPVLSFSRIIIGNDTLANGRLQEWLSGDKKLSHNRNYLQFEWSSDQLYMPEASEFYYKLIGMDSVWKSTEGINKIKFTNLPSGKYVLQVKVVNAFGVEGEIISISFFIDKAIWWKWWFIAIEILIIGGLIITYMKMRERHLKREKEKLENIVMARTREVVDKAREISHQNEIIELKNKELTDSILYAKNIQNAVMSSEALFREIFPASYILFLPKDIVSGDFFWFAEKKDRVIWAVVDCTGHGVPGGFMTMLGSSILNQVVNEEGEYRPDEILNALRIRVIDALNSSADSGRRDGMDASLVCYFPESRKLQFAGAHQSLYIVRRGQLMETRGDKFPIGAHVGEPVPFHLNEVVLEPGDLIVLSSDGFGDQFGGEKGKKFKSSNFEKLITEFANEHPNEQGNRLRRVFEEWRGDYEQIDDVLVIGVRI